MAIYKLYITDNENGPPPPGKIWVRLDASETDSDGGFGGVAIRTYLEMDIPDDFSDVAAVRSLALVSVERYCLENNLTFDPKMCILTGIM